MSDHRPASQPDDLARLLWERMNAGDLDGIVALYEPDAVLALPGGRVATGSAEIREAFEKLLASQSSFAPGEQRPVLLVGDLALTSARLASGAVTAEVARRQGDGSWRWVIDQPAVH